MTAALRVADLSKEARRVVLEAAIEVLRSKEPPEIPSWLRKLRDFEPRRLRAGRAAEELLRGVDQVMAFREVVVRVLAGAHADLRVRLEAGGPKVVEECLRDGADPGVLGALALTFDGPLGGFLAGWSVAASGALSSAASVDEARRVAEAAERGAAGRVERARSEAEAATAARDQMAGRLDEGQAELRKLRRATAVSDDAATAARSADDARLEAERARAEVERSLESEARQRQRLEEELRRLEDEVARLGRAAEAASEQPTGPERPDQLVEAASQVAEALEQAAAALRLAVAGPAPAPLAPAPGPAPPASLRRPTGAHPARGLPSGRARPRLPAGMNPDTPEGLTALLREGVTLLVDGYNAVLDREGMVHRQALVRSLAGLLRGTRTHARAYFDGVEQGEYREGAVDVVFTASDEEADDAILGHVASLPRDRAVVVVSSDRRVREGAVELGAEVVSSRTLLRALRLRRA